MGVSQMAIDALAYVREISPLLLILGAISFADLTIHFLVRLFKAGKLKMKW